MEKAAAHRPGIFRRYRHLPAPPRYGLVAGVILILALGLWRASLQSSPTPPPAIPTASAVVSTATSTEQGPQPTTASSNNSAAI